MHLSAEASAPKNSFVCARCVNLKVNAACTSKLDNSPRRYMCVCAVALHYIKLSFMLTLTQIMRAARALNICAVERSQTAQRIIHPAAHMTAAILSTMYTINLISLNVRCCCCATPIQFTQSLQKVWLPRWGIICIQPWEQSESILFNKPKVLNWKFNAMMMQSEISDISLFY